MEIKRIESQGCPRMDPERCVIHNSQNIQTTTRYEQHNATEHARELLPFPYYRNLPLQNSRPSTFGIKEHDIICIMF